MNENAREAQVSVWDEAHPWLAGMASAEEDDSIDEQIRYALDEMRFA